VPLSLDHGRVTTNWGSIGNAGAGSGWQQSLEAAAGWRTEMREPNAEGDPEIITVRFTEHQRELIERLRQERTFGDTPEEVVARIVREAVKERTK
jgi:hypothetical protein